MLRRSRRPRDEARLDMTPMIDVTFLLLVFFMCTLQFKTLEGKLSAYLPKEVGPQSTPPPDVVIEDIEVVLEVIDPGTRLTGAGIAPGRFVFGDDRRLEYQVGPRRGTDLEFVRERLRALRRAAPERQAVVAPQEGVVHAEVIELLDAMLDVGITEARIQGAREHR